MIAERDMVAARAVSDRVCRSVGVEFNEIAPRCQRRSRAARKCLPTISILGSGAGIAMAFADHMSDQYPDNHLRVADMAGSLTAAQRVTAIEYTANAYPTVLLVWSSIRPLDVYWDALWDRGFHLLEARRWRPVTWGYFKGYGECGSRRACESLFIRRLDNLWAEFPLGIPKFVDYLIGQ